MSLTQRILPRCYCGFEIGKYHESYENLIKNGVHPGKALDQLGIKKICCRIKFLSPVISPLGILIADPLLSQNNILNMKISQISPLVQMLSLMQGTLTSELPGEAPTLPHDVRKSDAPEYNLCRNVPI